MENDSGGKGLWIVCLQLAGGSAPSGSNLGPGLGPQVNQVNRARASRGPAVPGGARRSFQNRFAQLPMEEVVVEEEEVEAGALQLLSSEEIARWLRKLNKRVKEARELEGRRAAGASLTAQEEDKVRRTDALLAEAARLQEALDARA